MCQTSIECYSMGYLWNVPLAQRMRQQALVLDRSLPFLSAFSAALHFRHSAILCSSFWQKKHLLALLGFVKLLAAVLGFIVLFERLISCCGCITTIAFSVFLLFPVFSLLAVLALLTAPALAFAVCTKSSWNYLDERVYTMSIALFVGSLHRSFSVSVITLTKGALERNRGYCS